MGCKKYFAISYTKIKKRGGKKAEMYKEKKNSYNFASFVCVRVVHLFLDNCRCKKKKKLILFKKEKKYALIIRHFLQYEI